MPPEIQSVIDQDETADFITAAKRKAPVKSSLGFLAFGFIWLGFISIFWTVFLFPVLLGNEVHFTANGVPVTADLRNIAPLYMPAGIIMIFTLIGAGIFGSGLYLLFARGGWFVGTPKRLIHYRGKKLMSYDWEQFTGVLEVSGTPENGTITLELRTGKMVTRRRGGAEYVPNSVIAAGIANAFEIEKLCRKRIAEHDPTPSHSATAAPFAGGTEYKAPPPTDPISFKGIHE